MHRIRKMLAVFGTMGVLLALPAGTASGKTSGPPTAPDGTNTNNQTTVCHHNEPANGAVTVTNRNRTNANGSGEGQCDGGDV